MMRRTWPILMPMVILMALMGVLVAMPARAQQEGIALINAPQAGQTLVGVVTISGTASSPNFQRYRLDFGQQDPVSGEIQWFALGPEIGQQVTNGVLAQWDTRDVPDGTYQLRLRVVLRDGSLLQTTIPNLTVQNTLETLLPTPIGPATPRDPTPTPTEGPSPTPLIEQPPTAAPRPEVLSPVVPTAEPLDPQAQQDQLQFVLVFEALRNAFCAGAYLSLGAFGLLALYRLAYVRLRPRLRRLMMDLRGEESE